MILQHPFSISSRLLPCIKIADCTISLELTGSTSDNRDAYDIHFDFDDGVSITQSGLSSGCGGSPLQSMFSSALAFLGAAAEEVQSQRRYGCRADNEASDLFCSSIAEWAERNSDEISIIQCDIDETDDLICE